MGIVFFNIFRNSIWILLTGLLILNNRIQVIVFCTTGMSTSLLYLLMRETKMNVREIHSRKPQLYRTRVSEEFKQSKQMILITSDVSSRGMNYPDVTLVIQVIEKSVWCWCLEKKSMLFQL